MFFLDKVLIGSVRFVLDKVSKAVDQEINDEDGLRTQLLAAQMRLEEGEIEPEEFATLETEILAHLRVIQERKMGATLSSDEYKVIGAEAIFEGEAMGAPAPAPIPAPPSEPTAEKRGKRTPRRSRTRRG